MSDFSVKTRDIHGLAAPIHDLYKTVMHTGNGKEYTIIGVVWDGETDEWNHLYVSPEGVFVCRPVSHLTGNRSDGTARYIPVATNG